MLIKLTTKEKILLSNMPYYTTQYKRSTIQYVYIIRAKRKILYIGKTGNPLRREISHRTWLNASGIENYTFTIIGPLQYFDACSLEQTEVTKRKYYKYLKNKNYTNNDYRYNNKEIRSENYRQKTICLLRKGGEIKKMVSQYVN